MSSRPLLVGIQQCTDSNRALAERLFTLAHVEGQVTSLRDLKQMLKQSRGVLEYLFLAVSNNGQTLSHGDADTLNRMLSDCETGHKYVSERILQSEQETPRDAQLNAAMKVHQIWLDFPDKKSNILSDWLKQIPPSLPPSSTGSGNQHPRPNRPSVSQTRQVLDASMDAKKIIHSPNTVIDPNIPKASAAGSQECRLNSTASRSFELPLRLISAAANVPHRPGFVNNKANHTLPLEQQLPEQTFSNGHEKQMSYADKSKRLTGTLGHPSSHLPFSGNDVSPKGSWTTDPIKEAHARGQTREVRSTFGTLLAAPRDGNQREEDIIAKTPEQPTDRPQTQGLKRKRGETSREAHPREVVSSNEPSGFAYEESDDDADSPLPSSSQRDDFDVQGNYNAQMGHDLQDSAPSRLYVMKEAVLVGAHHVLKHLYHIRSSVGKGPRFQELKAEFKTYYKNLTNHLCDSPDTSASLVLARYMTEQASIHRHLQTLASSVGVTLPDIAKASSAGVTLPDIVETSSAAVSTSLNKTANTSRQRCNDVSQASRRQNYLRTCRKRTMGRSTDIDWGLLAIHTEGFDVLYLDRVIMEAMVNARAASRNEISQQDFLKAILEVDAEKKVIENLQNETRIHHAPASGLRPTKQSSSVRVRTSPEAVTDEVSLERMITWLNSEKKRRRLKRCKLTSEEKKDKQDRVLQNYMQRKKLPMVQNVKNDNAISAEGSSSGKENLTQGKPAETDMVCSSSTIEDKMDLDGSQPLPDVDLDMNSSQTTWDQASKPTRPRPKAADFF